MATIATNGLGDITSDMIKDMCNGLLGKKSIVFDSLGMLSMNIIQHPMMHETKQVRFPRSKKKRILKKWRKNKNNYDAVPIVDKVYVMGNNMICSPKVIDTFKDFRNEEKIKNGLDIIHSGFNIGDCFNGPMLGGLL